MTPIPAFIDHIAILADLKARGWLDYKIEIACGFGRGYIAQIRHGHVKALAYHRAARLYNFWVDENQAQGGAQGGPGATTGMVDKGT